MVEWEGRKKIEFYIISGGTNVSKKKKIPSFGSKLAANVQILRIIKIDFKLCSENFRTATARPLLATNAKKDKILP